VSPLLTVFETCQSQSQFQSINRQIQRKSMSNKFIAYTRVQRNMPLTATRQQQQAIRKYAAESGLEIGKWLDERGSALSRSRPVFKTLLKLLRKHEAKGIIVTGIDRLTRDLEVWSELSALMNSGIEIHCVNQSASVNRKTPSPS